MTKLSRADLVNEDLILINDNTLQEIEPSDHRQSNQNIYDSFLSLVDDNIEVDATDFSLKYQSTVSGAWDNDPSHDFKLTPKSWIDANFTRNTQLGSIDLSSNALSGIDGYALYYNNTTNKYDLKEVVSPSELSSYAKLDGSNTPFTSTIRFNPSTSVDAVTMKATSDLTKRFLKFYALDGTTEVGYIRQNGTWYSQSFFGETISIGSESSNAGSIQNNGGVLAIHPVSNFQVRFGGLPVIDFANNTISFNAYKGIQIGDVTSGFSAGMLRYDPTTNKHQGYNGTTWNDMY